MLYLNRSGAGHCLLDRSPTCSLWACSSILVGCPSFQWMATVASGGRSRSSYDCTQTVKATPPSESHLPNCSYPPYLWTPSGPKSPRAPRIPKSPQKLWENAFLVPRWLPHPKCSARVFGDSLTKDKGEHYMYCSSSCFP